MTTPCERLKAYADAAFGCMVSKLAQISGGAIDSTDGFWRHIAADQQQVAIKLSHQVEFAFRSGKDPLALDSGHPLEIAERLECDRPEAQVAHQVTDIRRGSVMREEVIFKNLDPLELSGRNSFELVFQGTAQGNRGDSRLHRCDPF